MSTSSKAVERACRAVVEAPLRREPVDRFASREPAHDGLLGGRGGFTLVEVLVALVVAGLVLPALARALSGAWSASRMPMDVVSAVTLARDVAAGGSVPDDARRLGYAAARTQSPVTLLILPSRVAPAPRGTDRDETAADLAPDATPSGIRLAVPKGFTAPPAEAASRDVALSRVSVAVRTPAGRRVVLDSLRVDDAPR